MNNVIEWHVSSRYETNSQEIFARLKSTKDYGISVENGVILWTSEKNKGCVPPLLSVPYGELESLMTAMWAAGIRPTNGEGSSGQLGATERHLTDMKAIAFKMLNIEK